SAVLIQQGGKHHVLEIMSDGKAHLTKNVKIEIDAYPTWSDYSINGKSWRAQTKGVEIPNGYSVEQLQSMMQELFNQDGEYNFNLLSSDYNVCHSAQEK